jgi:sugar phosphate isomerase/epimerase
MFLGYNTNGFSYHQLTDAIEIIAELGYRGIGLTLDVHHLDPFRTTRSEITAVRKILESHNLRCVIETGARFILDRRRKHQPTLLSPVDSERRSEFLRKSIEIAQELNADCVSFWSGTPTEPENREILEQRLIDHCLRLCDYAASRKVKLAFEPEPGMLIDKTAEFEILFHKVNHPSFGLTLDIGHLICLEEPVRDTILRWKDHLWNVHLDDMKRGIHDHLMFGEGEVNFQETFATLKEIHFNYGAYVELSRHAHDAVRTAEKSFRFLSSYLTE